MGAIQTRAMFFKAWNPAPGRPAAAAAPPGEDDQNRMLNKNKKISR
jgi:hypothetical protein